MTTIQTSETTSRYVAKCRNCGTGNAHDVFSMAEAVEFINYYLDRSAYLCRSCGRHISTWTKVQGRFSPARQCDDRCTSATGYKCECQCGGRNHGSNNL